jgi:hypothetical protein
VRRELARLYRDARSGRVDAQTATRLGYLLDLLRRAIEAGDHETRLRLIEQALPTRKD